ncbi:RING finger protein 145-like [Saccostrea echinata]|uniref:RING finger protein 145-like n=1 Tax=Saccostrea echinata TaxID=191078 RepID=UPI002A83651C|nr:RING finger protein 145-like [Saccostrea echinata]
MKSLSRGHLLSGLTNVLRLPGYFTLEAWLLSSSEKTTLQQIVTAIALILAAALILLQNGHLFLLYKSLIGGFLLLVMYFYALAIMDWIADSIETNDLDIIKTYVALYAIGLLVVYLFRHRRLRNSFLLAYTLITVTKHLGFRFTISQYTRYCLNGLILSHLIPLAVDVFYLVIKILTNKLKTWVYLAKNSCIPDLYHFIKSFVDSIVLPSQLFLFSMVSFIFNICYYMTWPVDAKVTLSQLGWVKFLSLCAGECYKTPLGLVATSIAISYVFYYLNAMVNVYLYGLRKYSTRDDYVNGWVEGLVVFLISIRSGILTTYNAMEYKVLLKRAFVIRITLLFAVAVFLNGTYEKYDSVILSFSTSLTAKLFKHFRALLLYFLLMICSLSVAFTISQLVHISVGIPVIIICLSTSLQVLASIATYGLFLYDGARSCPLENLEDSVYYIRSTVRVIDFLGSVILACTGVWVIKTEGLSWIQTPMLILHCFVNVWQRLQYGWKSFLQRREAMRKVDSLASATKKKINDHDDVCPVCFHIMSSAKITPCGHFYHRACLKKWSYIRDSCPLCSRKIFFQ